METQIWIQRSEVKKTQSQKYRGKQKDTSWAWVSYTEIRDYREIQEKDQVLLIKK